MVFGRRRETGYEGLTPGTEINGTKIGESGNLRVSAGQGSATENLDLDEILSERSYEEGISYLNQLSPRDLKQLAIEDIQEGCVSPDMEDGAYLHARAAALSNLAALTLLEQLTDRHPVLPYRDPTVQ